MAKFDRNHGVGITKIFVGGIGIGIGITKILEGGIGIGITNCGIGIGITKKFRDTTSLLQRLLG